VGSSERGTVRPAAATVADDHAGVRRAVEVLEQGGIVVLPTDTVYGLAARPDRPDAVGRVYLTKRRPERLALPVLASSLEQVGDLGVALSDPARRLAERWWPGPLTLAFGFAAGAARPAWLSDRDEVAVRIPDHPFVRTLIRRTGVLLVTSANRHGTPTAHTCGQVTTALGHEVDLYVDGGALTEVPSTLVNVRGPEPAVEREGAIARRDVARLLGGPS
jgi:L-threonylcarbamoyladenylate synthase